MDYLEFNPVLVGLLWMARNAHFYWKLFVALASFIAAVSVYCFARIYPPEILSSIQAVDYGFATHTLIFGSAPSFFYTLALGLVIGVCASSRSSARLHCLIWIVLCFLLEISQHAVPSALIMAWLPDAIPESSWNLFGPYWAQGVFDPIDLMATFVGGLIALALITRLSRGDSNAGA